MATMKAARIHSYGGPEVLRYEDIEKPAAGPGQVLVQVRAAAVNPVDWKIREGYTKAMFETPFPAILGGDVSGVVEAVGSGVTNVKPGDEIYAMIGLKGAYAEYIVTQADFVARKPKNMSFIEAASVPLASLTAHLGLIETAQLKSGQRVLIHAAAGGVGTFAVQLAHNVGAHVIGTASKTNEAYVRGLGANEVIDYKTTKFEDAARDIDVVFDLMGGEIQGRSFQVLKPTGLFVSATSPIDQKKADEAKVKAVRVTVTPNGKVLAKITEMIEAGKLKTTIAATYPLSEVAKAHEQSKAGHTRGKIVLEVRK